MTWEPFLQKFGSLLSYIFTKISTFAAGLIMVGCALVFHSPVLSADQGPQASSYPYGCDCASLQACVSAACVAIGGIACISSKGRQAAACLCRQGGMKHCKDKEWSTLINNKWCSNLLNDYCHGGGNTHKCWVNDPVCRKR